MELRGLEPLTPTLPGTGITPEQAGYGRNPAVVAVFGGVTVVSVVVKIVVSTVTQVTDGTPASVDPGKGEASVYGQPAA